MNTITPQDINIIISIVATVAAAAIAWSAWQRRHAPGANWFIGMSLCVCWVTFCYIFEAAAGFNVDLYVTFSKLEYVGLMYIPLFWLNVSRSYGGSERPISPVLYRVLIIFPAITIALAWTNEWHGLIWREAELVDRGSVPIFTPVYGVWFWINAVFSYSVFLAGSFFLARQALSTWRIYRIQASLILIGSIIPWLSNLLQVFDDLNPFPGLYVNALFLGTAMLSLGVGLFRLRLLDLMPVARDAILQNIPMGYVITDIQYRVLAYNNFVKPFLTAFKGDPVGTPLAEVFPTFPPTALDPHPGTQPQWRHGDRIIDISMTPVIDWRGKQRGHLLVFNDVTARVQAQEALQASEQRQRALLQALPDLMVRIRGDGTLLDYHAGSTGDFSFLPQDLIGQKIDALWTPEVALRNREYIEQVLQSGSIAAYEYSTHLNGEERHFENRIVASGENEVVAIMRDVAARKQSERRALALALERERIAMIARFIQDTTHEFRTPLSVIRVSLHLLKRTESAEKREQRAEQIEEQITRLTDLVDVLVKMSTLDGDVQFAFRWSNVNQIIDLLHRRNLTLSEKGAEIHFELQDNLPPLLIDPDRMLEALQELLNNAARYTPAHGIITLRTRSDATGVCIEISDTGAGIPSEAMPHIFERFYRLDRAHSTPGFGLGLSISQRIIELHGGTIDVESTLGTGTRFVVRLPYQNRSPSETLLR